MVTRRASENRRFSLALLVTITTDQSFISVLEIWPTFSGVCRRVQDSEPIEIGEALGIEFHIAPVLLTTRANWQGRNFLYRQPLPLMGGNKPHRSRSGCE